MNNWKNVLKIQVLDTTTSLSSINEPMVEDEPNCCEIAIDAYEDLIVKYSHMGRSEDEKKWAKEAWDDYIFILKEKGSYNTWPVQEHLEHRKGGLNEATCDFFWWYLPLLEPVDVAFNVPSEIRNQVKDILNNWEECKNE
jgi:hypothetical protein